jgi:MFS transporter, PPP family, 3-phenylpropionic acid transporter
VRTPPLQTLLPAQKLGTSGAIRDVLPSSDKGMPANYPAGPLHARLAGFYFFYFASIGAFLPFFGLYLEALSFTPKAIGELMAVTMATKIVAPMVWGWIADHTGQRLRIVRIASLLAAATFSALLVVAGYWWILAILACFSFFWNAALPQFEATTLDHLGEGAHRYGRIRLWGSIGFIITVALLGPALERFGIDWLPVVILALLVAIWIATLLVTKHTGLTHPNAASFGNTLRQPTVIALLVACFLLQASHGPYYTFFSIYMEDYGYTRSVIGELWALGVVAEIGVFLYMSRWLPRFGARKLLLIALSIAALRWLLIATCAEYLPVMLLAQTLHAGSFGLYHAAAIHMISQLFPGQLQGRGQALYSGLSFGLGGAVGSLMSGYIWSAAAPQCTFVVSAVLAAAAALVVWQYVRPSLRLRAQP